MDPRSAAHVLSQIGALLELRGENRFKTRAYESAARAVLGLETDDLGPMLRSGDLARIQGVGPATLNVLRDLVDTGSSEYFERLSEETPEGLLEMMRVPGLGPAKIHQIHVGLGIDTLQELEEAANDGRLAKLPKFGPRTAEKIRKGIAFLRETGAFVLYPHAAAEGRRLLAMVASHPDVERASVAGDLRRHREIVREIAIVASVRDGVQPAAVAASLGRAPGVRDVTGGGSASPRLRFVDGTLLELHCVRPAEFAVALWSATGSTEHLAEVRAAAATRGISIGDTEVTDAAGRALPVPEEEALYRACGMAYVEPEMREGRGETDAAIAGALPALVTVADIRGVLHCHSQYSDGSATIAELAAAARSRGWTYIGISDHSQSAFYAGGLDRDAILRQHEEIDRVNDSQSDVRVLKGIEADILPCGRVDYDEETLGRFDYVIGSVHSRFGMDGRQMTDRVLKALDDPHLVVLGHPTGRLLLTREPYALDVGAVLEKAAEKGIAVELNADPHRLDLDWRYLHDARKRGVSVEIGPDAHSIHSLDNVEYGVGMARKGWLSRDDVLNARDADGVLAFAASRRAGAA
jgi:DNA polymerase (family X)